MKQACEYKWCINKTKKGVDVARLSKNKGSHQLTLTKKKTVMVTNSMNKAGDGVVAKMRKAVKKSKGVKEINGAKETNGGKLVLTKVARHLAPGSIEKVQIMSTGGPVFRSFFE